MIFSGIPDESVQGQNLMTSLGAQVTEWSVVFVQLAGKHMAERDLEVTSCRSVSSVLGQERPAIPQAVWTWV